MFRSSTPLLSIDALELSALISWRVVKRPNLTAVRPRALALLALVQPHQCADGKRVPLHAETDHDAARRRRYVRVVPEFLPGMDVRDVKLDDRRVGPLDRVVQRDRPVGEGAGIEHDANHVPRRDFAARFMNPVDELALVVRLTAIDLDAQLLAFLAAQPFDVSERIRAVDRRLTGA